MDSPRVTLRTGSHVRTVVNRNSLVRQVPYVNGVKTGHTAVAGNLLVGSASRDGVTVVSVVMGEPSEAQRDADSLALLRFGLASFRRATLLREERVMARPALAHRDEHVNVIASAGVVRTIRRADRSTVVVEGVPAEVDGPIAAGTRVGTAVVRLNGRVVQRVPLVTAAEVTAASLGDKARDAAGGIGAFWAIPVLLVGSLLGMGLRRRALRRRRAVRRRERRAA
jgi:D-alanyl-D-alanine carboxypeptidase (penicillin-binding protein 5/6)